MGCVRCSCGIQPWNAEVDYSAVESGYITMFDVGLGLSDSSFSHYEIVIRVNNGSKETPESVEKVHRSGVTPEKPTPSGSSAPGPQSKIPPKRRPTKTRTHPLLKQQPRWSPSTSVKPGRLISMPSSMASTATTPRPPPSSRTTWHSSARTGHSTATPTWLC